MTAAPVVLSEPRKPCKGSFTDATSVTITPVWRAARIIGTTADTSSAGTARNTTCASKTASAGELATMRPEIDAKRHDSGLMSYTVTVQPARRAAKEIEPPMSPAPITQTRSMGSCSLDSTVLNFVIRTLSYRTTRRLCRRHRCSNAPYCGFEPA